MFGDVWAKAYWGLYQGDLRGFRVSVWGRLSRNGLGRILTSESKLHFQLLAAKEQGLVFCDLGLRRFGLACVARS